MRGKNGREEKKYWLKTGIRKTGREKKSKRIEEKERKKKKREVQASMSKKYIMHDE